MSDPGIGVNSTQVPNDPLGDILAVVKEMRDLMRQKVDQEKTPTLIEAPHQSDGLPQLADAATQELLNSNMASPDAANQNENSSPEADPITQERLNTDTRDEERDIKDSWPNDETISRYKVRCAKHRSECEKMQVELGCFIAHAGIVGGDKDVIEGAENLRKYLIEPVQSLEKAFDVTPSGRPDAMGEVRKSFSRLWVSIYRAAAVPHERDALYPDKLWQWNRNASIGYNEIRGLVQRRKYVECLKFINNESLSDLETTMGGVVEALMTFEEKSSNEWLATLRIADSERRCAEYIDHVFPPTEGIGELGAWPTPNEIEHLAQRLAGHRRLCDEMRIELDHLVSHFTIIGGDKTVIEATNALKEKLFSYVQYLEQVVHELPQDFRTELRAVFLDLLYAVTRFQSSLYHQKHAFYFRKVKQWVTCLWVGAHRILRLLCHGKVTECLTYIHGNFLSEFERAMIGIAHGEEVKLGENSAYAVPEELKTFGKESLPKFLVDQMERDTTRYINLTTIATFFSSVTATTLQFTYAPLQNEASDSLRGVVNLFWFVSLVFSVSSGVSSLLGLTWRKSSIYDTRAPPRVIRLWFNKAPMLFLIVAAVAFVIGLNLFSYLSLQPRFVSFATSILTGLHGMCLLVVTLWFIYQLKRDSVWAGWIRAVMNPITEWIRAGVKWVWIMTKWPYNMYKRNKLHLQRNIFWAFGIHNRVARLNYDIHWISHHWPNPYLLSRIVRFIVQSIKKGWLVTKKAISDLSHLVRVHICACFPAGRTEGDIESIGRERHEKAEGPEETQSENLVKNAENEFREALLTTFNDDTADWVMSTIKGWKPFIMRSEERAKRYIGGCLWGYPDLRKKFYDVVRPAWIDESEKAIRKIEEELHHEAAVEHADNNPLPLGSDVADQDQNITAFTQATPPQSSQPASLHKDAEHLPSTQMEVKPNSPDQLDRSPPPLDERPPSTTSPSPVVLGSTPADPSLLASTTVIETGFATLNETEEITSISENENEEELGE